MDLFSLSAGAVTAYVSEIRGVSRSLRWSKVGPSTEIGRKLLTTHGKRFDVEVKPSSEIPRGLVISDKLEINVTVTPQYALVNDTGQALRHIFYFVSLQAFLPVKILKTSVASPLLSIGQGFDFMRQAVEEPHIPDGPTRWSKYVDPTIWK